MDRGFSGAPVVNAAGRAVGVISLSDIVVHDRNRSGYDLPDRRHERRPDAGPRRDDPGRLCGPAGTRRPATVIEEMVLLRVHRLFVTDADGVLVGVIAASDIVRRLMR